MRTWMKKRDKTTDISFNEADPMIEIRTYNTDLKNRLTEYATRHSDECQQIENDSETGCMLFRIRKGRLSFRLTAPYSEERREKSREVARNSELVSVYGKSEINA